MMTHELKCWPEYFQAILEGRKKFEYRKNDRGFKVGDILILREWDPRLNNAGVPRGYTGRVYDCRVTYILDGPAFGRHEEQSEENYGFCIMSIERIDP